MPLTSDPKLEQWLHDLPPRDELATRFALRQIFPDARGNRAFIARVDELRDQLKLSEKELAGLLRRASTIAEDLGRPVVEPPRHRLRRRLRR